MRICPSPFIKFAFTVSKMEKIKWQQMDGNETSIPIIYTAILLQCLDIRLSVMISND